MSELNEAAEIVINDCMAVEDDETVLVITDRPLRQIGRALFNAAEEVASEALLTEISPRENHGAEPPAAVAKLMQEVDVALMPTSKSLSHTRARKEANQAGVRAATLPGITEEMMIRTLTADYEVIGQRSQQVAAVLDQGQEAHLTTKLGTDLKMSLARRAGQPDTGIYHEAGIFGNLPAGEAYIAPVEGSAEGKLVIDGVMSGIGILSEPITLLIEEGYVVEIKGGQEAAELEELIAPYGQPAKNIAELGIGTNHQATLTGHVLEDEKVLGTVHVAIGDNSSFGGEVEVASHLDGIVKQPTLQIDDQVIMKDGNLELV
ncbi:MAG: aminopeptidase [Bacillota bacterium]